MVDDLCDPPGRVVPADPTKERRSVLPVSEPTPHDVPVVIASRLRSLDGSGAEGLTDLLLGLDKSTGAFEFGGAFCDPASSGSSLSGDDGEAKVVNVIGGAKSSRLVSDDGLLSLRLKPRNRTSIDEHTDGSWGSRMSWMMS